MAETQKPSDKKHRKQITKRQVRNAVIETQTKLKRRLNNEKGWGTWLSRHEILGFAEEERFELCQAVHSDSLEDVKEELLDLAVGCIFAVACINADTLDW